MMGPEAGTQSLNLNLLPLLSLVVGAQIRMKMPSSILVGGVLHFGPQICGTNHHH